MNAKRLRGDLKTLRGDLKKKWVDGIKMFTIVEESTIKV